MNQKSETARLRLAEGIDRRAREGRLMITAIPTLALIKRVMPTKLSGYLKEPSLCLIAQGEKQVILGSEIYTYDEDRYLIASVELPVEGQIIRASREKPYLGLMMRIDPKQVAKMIVGLKFERPNLGKTEKGIAVSPVSEKLWNSVNRLVDLLDDPDDIPALAPLIQQEIIYRILTGPKGARLMQLATTGSRSHQISRALDWMRENYTETIRVDDLADMAGMSPSSFHSHFRAMTAMTPLQFQKKLRLNEAKRLMLTESLDAATASFQVGYESPSQFSREYSRLFGAPPVKHIKILTQQVPEMT